MAGKRVAVLDPNGQFGTIDESEVDQLPEGARVLTKQQLAERKLEQEYADASTLSKIGGLTVGIGARPPALDAYSTAGRKTLSAGLDQAVIKETADAIKPGAGAKYAERLDDLETGHPTATTAGTAAGIAGGIAIGAAGGAGAGAGIVRAAPMNATAALGAPVEAAVARGLAGLASRGALGRAAATGASMAARGAVEGAVYSGIEQATSDVVHDTPMTGEKIHTAMGHGVLAGGVFGGALGFGGSLLGSGVRSLAGRASRNLEAGAAGAEAEAAAITGAPEAPRTFEMPRLRADELDAGLRGPLPKAESPLSFGAERRPVQLRPDVGQRGAIAVDEPFAITQGLRIDPDAGIHAPRGKVQEPLFSMFSQGSNKATRRAAVEAGLYEGAEKAHQVRLAADLFKPGEVKAGPRPIRSQFDIGFDPEAGIAKRGSNGKFQGKLPAEDALKLSSAKNVPRDVNLSVGDELAPLETKSPIKLPGADTPTTASRASKKTSILDMLADPNNAGRALAQDQAWKAVGAGYGLQTTRYAKEAAKYFPNGTRDLGEVALRYGLVDMGGPNTTPLQAAIAAAKSGAAAEIAPKAEMAVEQIGRQIGELTDASGARVKLADVERAIEGVRQPYDRIAGNEHVVNAVDTYAASLRSKLGSADDVSIQSLLEQRKGLDRIVYQETKTLDPGRRVEALRNVRSELESLITKALDDASGDIPGAARERYQTLKRDYHALRILQQAAEDSAARASKGATLGLGEKFAVAQALATGHVGAAPVLGLGMKVVRERGNAAAAAFLARAAERGTVAEVVRLVDQKVARAAKGVLREGGRERAPATKKTSALSGREQQKATIKEGQKLVRQLAKIQADPDAFRKSIEETASTISQTAGQKAGDAWAENAMRAFTFVLARVPRKERLDPLDPSSEPPLTFDEADRLITAHRYASQPMTVLDDLEHGIVTPDVVAAAKTFMPESWQDFQMRLNEHLQTQMTRNAQLSQSQRLRIFRLLGKPASADQRPEMVRRYQANFTQQADPSAAPAKPSGSGKPVNLTTPQSAFDRAEARAAG